MKEVVFKFPEKKPLFFGVKFDIEQEAMMLNQSWVNLPGKEWDAKLEIIGEKLSIIIYCKKEFKQIYIIPKYDRIQLKKFMRLTRQNDKINFGHVVSEKDGTDKIARTSINNSVWVLPIRNIEVYNASEISSF